MCLQNNGSFISYRELFYCATKGFRMLVCVKREKRKQGILNTKFNTFRTFRRKLFICLSCIYPRQSFQKGSITHSFPLAVTLWQICVVVLCSTDCMTDFVQNWLPSCQLAGRLSWNTSGEKSFFFILVVNVKLRLP